ncbi:hypothetical protein [Ruminococcus sp. FC2018]|uniref:hypothetical protein n=1 Tax=Ruminococcus sp. FC2018 TaxID=1410617 RepID=UPI00048FF6D4|nr:hypothetical protein [Ruminococcus sp. FC2018]
MDNEVFVMENVQEFIDRIKADSHIAHYLSAECDFDLEDDKQLEDDLYYLLEGGKCQFKLTPFGCDGCGGVYVLAEDGRVGYIDSEGSAGFAAQNIRDFFSILLCCRYLSDWSDVDFDSVEDFMECIEDKSSPSKNYKERIAAFIADCGLESEPEKVYEMFRNGVNSQPPLEIKATDDDYEDYEPLFQIG